MIRIGRPYREHDLSEPFDAVVIGSGVGGLGAAALLARHAGKRVLVLERHFTPGGFTHVFRRRGWEWDVGLHYVGAVQNPGSLTRRLFDHVTGGRLRWTPLAEVYDRIAIGDRVYDLAAGPEAFAGRMKERFPGEARAIDRYLETVRQVGRSSRLYFAEKALPGPLSALVGPVLRRPLLRHARLTTGEALGRITANRELIGVLTGQYGDYGLPPGRSSFAIHAMLVRHYLWGGSYPVGGSSQIAAAIAPAIETAGGRVLYQAEVEEILVRRGRAVGVRMADGAEIHAPVVISDAGVRNTFLRLLPRAVAERHGLEERLRGLAPSLGHLCLYAGFRGTDAELGLPRSNLWIYPGYDHDANLEAFLEDPEDAPLPLVYASFPSARDPSFASRCPGHATMELITVAPFDLFRPWRERPWRRRGGEYEALKVRFAERMLAELDRWMPGLAEKITFMEISTPLSTRHLVGYGRGEIYGLEHSPERFRQRFLRPRTPIRGLYLTGQDVTTCGVSGALAAGYLTASVVLGKNLLRAAGRG